MSGYLAIDRERVRLLAAGLGAALDDAARWRLDDPAATEVRLGLRRMIARFDDWPRRLTEVQLSGALTDFWSWGGSWANPTILGDRTLISDTADPATHQERMLLALGLGERLRHLDLDSFDLATVLTELQAIAGDPIAMAALLEAMGAEQFDAILDACAHHLRSAPLEVTTGRGDAPAIIEFLHLLGEGLPATSATGAQPALLDIIESTDEFVAALVLTGALTAVAPGPRHQPGADGEPADPDDPLTESITITLGRIFDRSSDDPLWRTGATSVTTALSDQPWLARDVLLELAPRHQEALILHVDPLTAGAMLRAATDPTVFTADEARAPLLVIVDVVGTYGAGSDQPSYAGLTPSTAEDPFPVGSWWFDPLDNTWHPESITAIPTGIGMIVAPWAPFLIAPTHDASWSPGSVTPWDISGHDDALSQTVVAIMASEAEALALRYGVSEALAGSALSTPADQVHFAYLAGAIEDAARSAGYDSLDARVDDLATMESLLTFPFNFAPTLVAVPAGEAISAATAAAAPDVRSAIAVGEAAGVDVGISIGLGVLAGWVSVHAPGVAPFSPVPPPAVDDVETGDRGDRRATEIARQLRDWAETEFGVDLDDEDPGTPGSREAQAREAIAIYERTRSASFDGTAFSAG